MTYFKTKFDEVLKRIQFKNPSVSGIIEIEENLRPIEIPPRFKFKTLRGGKFEKEDHKNERDNET